MNIYIACFERGGKIMGRQLSGQEHLLYAFNNESVVPQKHLLRSPQGLT